MDAPRGRGPSGTRIIRARPGWHSPFPARPGGSVMTKHVKGRRQMMAGLGVTATAVALGAASDRSAGAGRHVRARPPRARRVDGEDARQAPRGHRRHVARRDPRRHPLHRQSLHRQQDRLRRRRGGRGHHHGPAPLRHGLWLHRRHLVEVRQVDGQRRPRRAAADHQQLTTPAIACSCRISPSGACASWSAAPPAAGCRAASPARPATPMRC